LAFSVEDFQDLLRLLEARSEWRAELRRLLIPDEVLDLPNALNRLAESVQRLSDKVASLTDDVQRLTEAQRHTDVVLARLVAAQERSEQRLSALEERVVKIDERLVRLEERIVKIDERLGRLEEGQARLEDQAVALGARVGRLEEGQARLEEGQTHLQTGFGRLERSQRRLETSVAALRGTDLERRYREHAGGYFGCLIRRARVVGPDELDRLLDEGLESGAFDEDGADDVRLADLIVRGRRPGDEQETYVVLEASGLVEPSDVERAARRAALLGRVRPALAAVGGLEITSAAADLAQARAVWRLAGGRGEPPAAS
jgi:hypothetical protein